MAKKQTRRSVSIRGATYETLRAYCEGHSVSMSEFVEERIASFLASHGAVPRTASTTRTASTGGGLVLTPPSRPKPQAMSVARAKAHRAAESKLDVDQLHNAARSYTF